MGARRIVRNSIRSDGGVVGDVRSDGGGVQGDGGVGGDRYGLALDGRRRGSEDLRVINLSTLIVFSSKFTFIRDRMAGVFPLSHSWDDGPPKF
jgi:hypothetical protein